MQPTDLTSSMNADFEHGDARGGDPCKIVTFEVDGRIFGVDVITVREIKRWQPTTALPDAADHVLARPSRGRSGRTAGDGPE
jgi:hypothetical protein